MTDGSDQMRKSTSTAVPVSTAHQAPDLDYDFMKYNATEWRDHAREVAGEILQRLPEAERAWGAKRRSMIRILTRLIIDEERPARTPTRPAQQLWRWLFPREPWPRGSTVRWVRSSGTRPDSPTAGDARSSCRTPTPSRRAIRSRCWSTSSCTCAPPLQHGSEFRELETALCARVGLPPARYGMLE
jgi:hypothetical protein